LIDIISLHRTSATTAAIFHCPHIFSHMHIIILWWETFKYHLYFA